MAVYKLEIPPDIEDEVIEYSIVRTFFQWDFWHPNPKYQYVLRPAVRQWCIDNKVKPPKVTRGWVISSLDEKVFSGLHVTFKDQHQAAKFRLMFL